MAHLSTCWLRKRLLHRIVLARFVVLGIATFEIIRETDGVLTRKLELLTSKC